MPRKARIKSSSNIYHIILRGINRQIIFEDEEDNIRFLDTLQRFQEQCRYKVFAYCLMGNHVHLLLQVGPEPLEQVMRRICGSYVYWYNTKYQRVGNLFQDRFKSEPVNTDSYLLLVQRYIHQDPVKAGLVSDVAQYTWSSFHSYVNQGDFLDTHFILRLFNDDKEKAVALFNQYNQEFSDDLCLDIDSEVKSRVSDEDAKLLIRHICQVNHPSDLQHFDIATRNHFLHILKTEYHLSVRQLERLTGINRGVILRT